MSTPTSCAQAHARDPSASTDLLPPGTLPETPPSVPAEPVEQAVGPDGADLVLLSDGPLDIGALYERALASGAGAVSMFSGVTRDNFNGQPVERLEYEAYGPMAMREMAKICAKAREQWPDLLHVVIAHRIGTVPVSDASVVILASSPHRAESLAAVTWAIDALKASVPIWKKEFYAAAPADDGVEIEPPPPSRWKANSECFFHGHHGHGAGASKR